ncbi:transmembrane protein, putative [Medicago truncatula]|uniref:Transmembrane protein, putative n=1 Tax=Medicago truncatula TaxID=3880 RepID=G7KPA1_MEDTR|nr:transmembrane protein, putative [Medicago truncatula]
MRCGGIDLIVEAQTWVHSAFHGKANDVVNGLQPHLLVKKKNVMCYYGADSPLVTSRLIFFASVFFAIIFASNSCYSQSFSLSNLRSSLLIYPLKNAAHQL